MRFEALWKNVTKNHVFFGARSTLKLNICGAKGAFRKTLGSVTQTGYIKIVQRGEPLGRQGSNP